MATGEPDTGRWGKRVKTEHLSIAALVAAVLAGGGGALGSLSSRGVGEKLDALNVSVIKLTEKVAGLERAGDDARALETRVRSTEALVAVLGARVQQLEGRVK